MNKRELQERVHDFIEYDVRRQHELAEKTCKEQEKPEEWIGYKKALEWVLHCFDNLKSQEDEQT